MCKSNFVGRSRELSQLDSLSDKRLASLVTISGRRRIGKSRLVEEFSRDKIFYRFSGLPPTITTSAQDQRDEFARALAIQTGLPNIKTNDWGDLFILLAQKSDQKNIVVLFDEISWMAQNDGNFLGKLKNAWDMYFCKHRGLTFILCGSVSSWVEKNIISSTGFFGRISLNLYLAELDIIDSVKLLEVLGFKYSYLEKILILSITGGIPWYLEQIDPEISALQNIKKLCFEEDSILLNEFKYMFNDFFGRRSEILQSIVKYLANGVSEYSKIAEAIDYSKSCSFANYLNELTLSGFIKKDFTWSIKTAKVLKISHFRLSDNYLRFYFRYMQDKKEQIKQGMYEDFSVDSLPGFDSMLGVQFENLVLANRKLIHKVLKINPQEVVISNPYFQRKNTKQPGCQIDYLVQTKFKTLYVCEIKFSRKKIDNSVIEQVQDKIERLNLPKGFSALPVLIYAGEITDSISDSKYFHRIINFESFK
jgi:uncharacterized protein